MLMLRLLMRIRFLLDFSLTLLLQLQLLLLVLMLFVFSLLLDLPVLSVIDALVIPQTVETRVNPLADVTDRLLARPGVHVLYVPLQPRQGGQVFVARLTSKLIGRAAASQQTWRQNQTQGYFFWFQFDLILVDSILFFQLIHGTSFQRQFSIFTFSFI